MDEIGAAKSAVLVPEQKKTPPKAGYNRKLT